MHSRTRGAALTLAAAMLSLGVAACGDDDDDDGTAAGDGDTAAYCEYSASLDEGEGLPSDDELQRLADLAPSEIADQVETVVEQIQEEGEAVFQDESNEEFFDALEEVEAFEEQNCGRDDPDTDEGPADSEE